MSVEEKAEALLQVIAVNLRMRMMEKRINNKTLAEKVGVTQNYISYLLNCRRFPSWISLIKITDVLDCTPESLMSPIKKEDKVNDFMDRFIKLFDNSKERTIIDQLKNAKKKRKDSMLKKDNLDFYEEDFGLEDGYCGDVMYERENKNNKFVF